MLKYFDYALYFKDPASIYAQSLIQVHDNVMWYLVFVISFVYFMLYKILKDSLWSSFNKQSGLFKFIYLNPLFIRINTFIFFIFSKIFRRLFIESTQIIQYAIIRIILGIDKPLVKKPFNFFNEPLYRFFFFNISEVIYRPLRKAFWLESSYNSPDFFFEPLIQSYLATALFEHTNRGYYLFGRRFYSTLFSRPDTVHFLQLMISDIAQPWKLFGQHFLARLSSKF